MRQTEQTEAAIEGALKAARDALDFETFMTLESVISRARSSRKTKVENDYARGIRDAGQDVLSGIPDAPR